MGGEGITCCKIMSPRLFSHSVFVHLPLVYLLLLDLAVLSMQSSSLGSWFPVILVTVFNAGDTAGRLVSGM